MSWIRRPPVHRSSESFAALATALAKAQAHLVNPEKSLTATIRTGRAGETERSFRYAPLSSGLEIETDRRRPSGIDKIVLAISAPRRYRNKEHLRYVTQQPCLLCARKPSDAHHLRFVQPRALGRKSSDEFAVPLCRTHHRAVHRVGDEKAWWQQTGIDPIKVARKLWKQTRIEEGRIQPDPKVAQAVTSDQNSKSEDPTVVSQA